MTDNPFMRPEGAANTATVDLDAYVAASNALTYIIASGQEWFVNKRRLADGSVQRYIDRRERQPQAPNWRPSKQECDATKHITANYVRSNITQAEFNDLSRRGIVASQVDALLPRTANP